MAKQSAAEIKKELDRISRGPKGAMKRLKEVLDLLAAAGKCRNKETELALLKAVETIEAHEHLVVGWQRGLLEAVLRTGLCGLAKRKSKAAQAFVQSRLDRDYGSLPATCSIFMESPETAYDRLSPFFERQSKLVPHPVLDHALRVLQYGKDVLEPSARSGGPRTPDWIQRDPRWTDLAARLVALFHEEPDPAWKTTPFNAIDVLALPGTRKAERALIALVGVVSVGSCVDTWSSIVHEQKELRAALVVERKRLVAELEKQDLEKKARLAELERESDPHAEEGEEAEEAEDLDLLDRLLSTL